MAKTIVVISTYIDNTVREYQKDVTFYLFKTLEELDSYIELSLIHISEPTRH